MKSKHNKGITNIKLSLLGTNANGLMNKMDSLKQAISEVMPSIITLQETKVRKLGSVKLKGFQVFEKIRIGGTGGGLLTAVDQNLSPVLISTGQDEESEVLTVQAKVGHHDVRIINAYGPQEDDGSNKVYKFWQEIEQEIVSAKDENCLLILQMDANAKIGKENLKGDPNNSSANGRLLLDVVERQNLTIVNTLDICKGVITRERVTSATVEKSVIDYVIVCSDMKNYLEAMLVDDDRIHVLTKYAGTKGCKKKVLSDHNILVCKFSILFNRFVNTVRREFFKLKDKEGQELFLKETSSSQALANSFSENRTFPHNTNVFFKSLNGCIQKCFTKIRIRTNEKVGTDRVSSLVEEKLKLKTKLKIRAKNCTDILEKKIIEEQLDEIESYLTEKCAARNAATVKEYINSVQLDGNFSQLKLWKLKQKLCPKMCDPPMAKKDENGTLITAPNILKALYIRTYQNRLKNREMKEELMDVYFLKEELWRSRLVELRRLRTAPWNKIQLRKAMKSLKNNKTMDPNGMINEIFKEGCVGENLEDCLFELFKGIKEHFFFPEFVIKQNISTIYKNKGSRLEMDNDRGIFILTALKKILDNLIFLEKFEDIDTNMSDSNIGARKGRNVKNHLFIIYGIINSVIKGKAACIDIQIYDLEKAFDSLWLEDCMLDAFDSLPSDKRDDKLALLYESNRKNLVAVNTAVGITERTNIPNIVQQGGTWGPALCSNSVDTLGKKIRDRGDPTYLYKNTVRVLPLAMVDDINAISKCGIDSVATNTFINTQIELKKLRFHVPDRNGKSKCHRIHIGEHSETCPILKVHGTVMETVTEDDYLGDIISSDGKNKKNVEKRLSKGLGIITQIMNLLESISFGQHYIEIALLLRESMFINGILNNVEVWYGLSKAEIDEFEDLDRFLLRKILQTPVSTPKEAIYLELGIIPIGVLIQSRRINFLYYLLMRDQSEMIYQFFITQWHNPTRGDWTETVKQDLEAFDIQVDFEVIKSKSKLSFKNMVKKKALEYGLESLLSQKEKHSKMMDLHYTELKIQSYFTLPGIKIDEVRNIFKFRVHMSQFGENFRGISDRVLCPLCESHLDNQAMSLQCPVLKEKTKFEFKDIYSDNVSLEAAQSVTKMLKIRENLIGMEK